MTKKKDFYKPEELAEALQVNIMTIYRYIRALGNRPRLKAYKIGREYRIDRAEFNKFLNKIKTK